MELVSRIDDYGKGAWIALMVLGFVLFWPLGLALLVYLLWSGRMGCWNRSAGRWYNERARGGHRYWRGRNGRSTGNGAFDEYREETLRRLEEERQEFMEFLERLRQAKDRAEFDQFMKERDERPSSRPSGQE